MEGKHHGDDAKHQAQCFECESNHPFVFGAQKVFPHMMAGIHSVNFFSRDKENLCTDKKCTYFHANDTSKSQNKKIIFTFIV